MPRRSEMQSEHKEKQEKSLGWLLLVLAFTRSASLVSRVVNKPNTQLTSNADDFVDAKNHACQRETSLFLFPEAAVTPVGN